MSKVWNIRKCALIINHQPNPDRQFDDWTRVMEENGVVELLRDIAYDDYGAMDKAESWLKKFGFHSGSTQKDEK